MGKIRMGMKNKWVTQPSFSGTGSGGDAGGPVQVIMSIQLALVEGRKKQSLGKISAMVQANKVQ